MAQTDSFTVQPRRSPARLRWGTSIAVCAVFFVAGVARADSPPPCRLTRSPFLNSLALPSDLACRFDEDGNGLDDEIEEQIAACFVPEYRFSAAENALGPNEPVTLFNAYRIKPAAPMSNFIVPLPEIRFQFVNLFADDGGFAYQDDCPSDDSHHGDTQPQTLVVAVDELVDHFEARLVAIFADDVLTGQTQCAGDARCAKGFSWMDLEVSSDGHPVTYPSQGKHHLSLTPYPGKCGVSHEHCIENDGCGPTTREDVNDGLGVPRVPTPVHVPLFESMANLHPAFDGYVPVFDARARLARIGGNQWLNACSWFRFGVAQTTFRVHQDSLDDLGFVGDSLTRACFHGGYPDCDNVTGVGWTLGPSDDWVADADGDSSPEVTQVITTNLSPAVPGVGSISLIPEPTTFVATDPCPLQPSSKGDADGDMIDDACDPHPFRNTYLAGGGASYPGGCAILKGFLDSDCDLHIDGDDWCPASSGRARADANEWGESLDHGDGILSEYQHTLGALRRGDRCDPYPVASMAVPKMATSRRPPRRAANAARSS